MSQKERVLRWLRGGHTLTQLQALSRFGTMRLGAIVYDLRKKYGDEYIITEMIPVKNRFGKKIRIARYMI